MAVIKTCEEYVLRELENTQKENERLKDFLKKLVKKIEFKKAYDKSDTVHIGLYGWNKDEKELIDELKKYNTEEDNG